VEHNVEKWIRAPYIPPFTVVDSTHLITNTSKPFGDALVTHELLVLAALKGGEGVGHHSKDQGSLIELERVSASDGILLETSKGNTTNDNGETSDLGITGRRSVDHGVDQRGENRLTGFDNLTKERISAESKDGARMSSCRAEADRHGLGQVALGRLGDVLLGRELQSEQFDGVDLDHPHDECVDGTNTQLERGDCVVS
jgi:hypothetical protein